MTSILNKYAPKIDGTSMCHVPCRVSGTTEYKVLPPANWDNPQLKQQVEFTELLMEKLQHTMHELNDTRARLKNLETVYKESNHGRGNDDGRADSAGSIETIKSYPVKRQRTDDAGPSSHGNPGS